MPDGERPLTHPTAPEALLVCPICQHGLVAADYETHLRRVHRLFGYRGVRRSFDDTVEAMLDDLLKLPPFAVAWPALVRLAREEFGGQPESYIARRLSHALSRLSANNLAKLLPELAGLIAHGNAPLLAALAGENDVAARRLVLAGIALLPTPLDPLLMKPLRALLLDRRLPEEAQVQALAAVLPGIKDPPLIQDLLDKLIEGVGKAQAVNRLHLLEDQTDSNPVLEAYADRRQEQVRMSCPRCPVQLRRAAMMRHLWEEHRLVLDGLRVRDPWSIIEDWLDIYKINHNPELLTRCRVAAAKIADDGLARLQRLALARGLGDAEARRAVLEEAREQHASCCPACFSFVPVPGEAAIPPINLRSGRLSARGYSVEIDESGVTPELEVCTPEEVIYRGREPNRHLTPRGTALVAAGPLVLVAFLFALVWPATPIAPIRPVAVLLALAFGVHTLVRVMWRGHVSSTQRLLDYTWRFLVPKLHEKGFNEADSAFAAGLARLYGPRPVEEVPPEELARLLRLTEQAVKRGAAPPEHLAALCRVEVARTETRGQDPVALVARWVGRCFEGKFPLAFAGCLLHDWRSSWWTPGNLARLRILLCDLAFEAGFEVRNLIEAGRTAPALGAVFKAEGPQLLAALRLLWSMRPSRPWERFGDNVLTAFEMAADPDHVSELIEHHDVMLWQQVQGCLVVAEGGREKLAVATIQLTLLGVWLQDVVFRDPPRVCEVRLRSSGCDMKLGPHAFRSPTDLDPLSRQLEKWFRFGFHEFLPQIERVLAWQPPDRAALLRSWGAVACPECGKRLLPVAGEVGVGVEEKP
jgi:hypothetical protein